MSDKLIISLLRLSSPFPLVITTHDSVHNDGSILEIPSCCKKRFHKCADFYSSLAYTVNIEHHICPKGLSVFAFTINGVKTAISGLISFPENSVCPKEIKKLYGNNKIASSMVTNWFNTLHQSLSSIETLIQDKTKTAISILHDIQKTNSLIISSAESFILAQKGIAFEDKFEKCPESIRSIYKGSELLSNQMELITLLSNPAMITAGKKRLFEIFRFFDKIRLLYLSKAKKRQIKIHLASPFSGSMEAFDSFALVPHILIDNAIKYSTSNQTIQVIFSETSNHITINVESTGPLIEENERSAIFDMHVKGKYSLKFSSEGSGIGLYVAKQIVEGHTGKISIASLPLNKYDNDTPLAQNKFSVLVPKKVQLAAYEGKRENNRSALEIG